jgi:hypothetical protein
MTRVIVLILCLGSAAGIAGYTWLAGSRGEPTAVYVVAARAPETKPKPPPAANIDPGDRVGLTRALQRELKRVGCYNGEITGQWTTSTRMAMRAFTERVNASLPVDKPDPVLLSLVQGHREDGVCTPAAGVARDAGTDDAMALSPPAAKALPKAKPDVAEDVRPAAVAREKDRRDKDKKSAVADAQKNGPVPPEGMREKRPPRANQDSRPPKVVRDVLKVLGF